MSEVNSKEGLPHMDEDYSGNVFMVVAPSGAGKSSLVNALLAEDPMIRLSISHTTRAPRPLEQNGREYHFIDVAEFKARRARHEFLEWAEVHGNFYATSRVWIAEQMKAGVDVLMEIDWQGARQIKQSFADAVEIFILPPSLAALEERLRKRGQDEADVIVRRLLAAGGEIAHATESHYIVINENFSQALSELRSIIAATRLRVKSQRAKYSELFIQLGVH